VAEIQHFFSRGLFFIGAPCPSVCDGSALGRGACREDGRGHINNNISLYASHCYALLFSASCRRHDAKVIRLKADTSSVSFMTLVPCNDDITIFIADIVMIYLTDL